MKLLYWYSCVRIAVPIAERSLAHTPLKVLAGLYKAILHSGTPWQAEMTWSRRLLSFW
jgi:hypothetical protein